MVNRRMKHISVTKKLWLSVVCIVLGAIIIVGHAGYNSASHQQKFNQQDSLLSQRLDQAAQWSALAQVNTVRTQAALASGSAEDARRFEAQMAQTQSTLQTLIQQLTTTSLDAEQQATVQLLAQQRQQLQSLGAQALQLKAQGHSLQLQDLRQRYDQAAQAYIQALQQFVSQQAEQLAQMRSDMGAARQGVVRAAAINMVFLLLGIAVGAYLLINSIRRSLQQANQMAEQIASGDLNITHQSTRRDEFGQLLQSLQHMRQSLSRMIEDVRHSSEAIHLASDEIASGNQDLSQRTEITSSHLQQAAAAMVQLTQTLQDTAHSAQQAAEMAQQACGVAQHGGTVVHDVVQTMTDIHQRSQKIADIIGVIDGIAFQTNILALNAAVEAARAGDQGRGFAVVAAEVRSLAQRSAQAAKEIKALIQASVDRIADGAQLAQDAGSTMTEVVQAIQHVTQVMENINHHAAEQRDGVAQVNEAVGSLDQMTQQNAALVEESAAAAHSLRAQSEHLRALVQRFKVQHEAAQPTESLQRIPASLGSAGQPTQQAAALTV
ncbi:methyl-accepting chemotaxis protein [Comamonas kerstersii]|uniref:Methyl-accepting chemotaxis protein n=2 Tax=Comamonas kerstersii TaxID=225992 RepID=A0A1V0BAD2_9BURK|nr:methyl-accepting chemotaxis protein [Comamonas kerstersii]AQZ99638.1 methyl-accepting chemotaxis protein [Comamonas kerstersii]